MPTNRQRLHETVVLARANNQLPPTHRQNEGNWGVIAVEPVLSALGWQRVPKANRADSNLDGVAYEWPGNHQIDAVLFRHGRALAVVENKDRPSSARADLKRDRNQRRADWGIYSWFDYGGGFGWVPYVGGNPDCRQDTRLRLKDVAKIGDADGLARFAYPVLSGEVASEAWLDTPVEIGSAIAPRFDLLAIQRLFFVTLKTEIESRYGIPFVPNLHCEGYKGDLPTPTDAHTNLPDLLLRGWELSCRLHPIEEYIQCFFYHGSKNNIEELALKRYYDRIPEHGLVADFVRGKVLAKINDIRQAAGPPA